MVAAAMNQLDAIIDLENVRLIAFDQLSFQFSAFDQLAILIVFGIVAGIADRQLPETDGAVAHAGIIQNGQIGAGGQIVGESIAGAVIGNDNALYDSHGSTGIQGGVIIGIPYIDGQIESGAAGLAAGAAKNLEISEGLISGELNSNIADGAGVQRNDIFARIVGYGAILGGGVAMITAKGNGVAFGSQSSGGEQHAQSQQHNDELLHDS